MSRREEEAPNGMSYADLLLAKWQEVMDASENFHEELLLHNDQNDEPEEYDSEKGRLYIIKLCRLWVELYPKMDGRSDLREMEEEFKTFEPFIANPKKFTSVGDDGKVPKDVESKLFQLEMLMRKALEKLDVTRF